MQKNGGGAYLDESLTFQCRYRNGRRFWTLRAEIWCACREWFAKRDCKIPRNERLIAELATVRYTYTSSGKIQIESKENMRKSGRGSPDVADALCLTFASNAATALYGWSPTGPRSKALKRNLKGIV